ncbi:MAG: hypothetical protein AAB728_01985, partial [Patescibacteria group bacterium]
PWEAEDAWRGLTGDRGEMKGYPIEAGILNNEGVSFAETGKKKEAAEKFKEALKRAPLYPTALKNLVITLADLGDPDGIRDAIRPLFSPRTDEEWAAQKRLLDAEPTYIRKAEKDFRLALVSACEKAGKHKEAYEEMKKLDSTSYPAKTLYRDLAILAETAGLLSEALDWAEKAMKEYWYQPDLLALIKRVGEKDASLKSRALKIAAPYEMMIRLVEKGPLSAEDLAPRVPKGTPQVPGMPKPPGAGGSNIPGFPRHLPRPGGGPMVPGRPPSPSGPGAPR